MFKHRLNNTDNVAFSDTLHTLIKIVMHFRVATPFWFRYVNYSENGSLRLFFYIFLNFPLNTAPLVNS